MSHAIGSLAPWFGSKRTLAPAIVEEIGPHRAYWEPFCGSMAVLLAKPQSRTEVVNDSHGDLVNLARCIQHPMIGPALYRRLRRVLFSEVEFREALARIRAASIPLSHDQADPDRAFAYFVASWMGMNGVAGTSAGATNFCRRFSTSGGDPAVRFVGAVRSIPSWRRRMARVPVLRSDAIALIRKVEDKPGTVIYVDPPYLVKGAKYLHDFSPRQHVRLARALRRFKLTRVVMSYYDHPSLARLYPGWNVRRPAAVKSMLNSAAGSSGPVKAPEVLLVNGHLIGRDAVPAPVDGSMELSRVDLGGSRRGIVDNESLSTEPPRRPLATQGGFIWGDGEGQG